MLSRPFPSSRLAASLMRADWWLRWRSELKAQCSGPAF
jgi:hypothetical protein